MLDSDNVYHGLCGDLGFSDKDLQENIRLIGEIASLGIVANTRLKQDFEFKNRIKKMECSHD